MLQTRVIPPADGAYQYPLLIKRLLMSGARYEKTREIIYRDQLRYSYPTLIERVARLAGPDDIAALPFVANTALRDHSNWRFSRDGFERRQVHVNPSIFLNATLAVCEAVREGVGLSVLPDYAIENDLAHGRLIQVLPEWDLPSGGIHAVFPAARFRPAKVRAFVDVLVARVTPPGQGPAS